MHTYKVYYRSIYGGTATIQVKAYTEEAAVSAARLRVNGRVLYAERVF